jgi:hypothetical protein
MALKNNKTRAKPAAPSAAPDDRQRLQAVARALLGKLEESLREGGSETEAARLHERLFGARHSLVATLVTLSELLLTLEKAAVTPQAEEEQKHLSPADMALVEDFVRKQRGGSDAQYALV